jgi:hypothetical protein
MMEIYPLDWPRLSGKLWYGPPYYWEVADTKESIEIISAKSPYGLMVFFALLGLVVMAGTQLVLSRLPAFPDKGWATVGSVGVALALILACVFLHVTFSREQDRGPTLIISFARKEVRLPRVGKSWTFDNIVRWEIVHGAWVRRGNPHLFPDVISELQVVVENDNGEKSAWPIIGALGRHNRTLYAAANRIAMKMELQLVVTREGGPRDISVK